MIVRVATLSRDGTPRLTPLWFIHDRGRIYMNTRAESPAVKDIWANPFVVLLFEKDRGPRPGKTLRIRGRAAFQAGTALNRRMYIRSALKYHLSPGGLKNLLQSLTSLPIRARYYRERAGESGTIEVTPESLEFVPQNPDGLARNEG